VAPPGITQPRPQSLLVALGGFTVEQQAEPFGMREIGALRIGLPLGEGTRHAGEPELVHLVEGRMGQQSGTSSMGVAGAADVGMGGEQLALPCWLGRPPIEPVLEDRLDRSIGTGADVETAIAGRFQPLGAVLPRQPQDAKTRTVALLGMRPALEEQIAAADDSRCRYSSHRSISVTPGRRSS